MITPIIIQVIFWLGVIVFAIAALVSMGQSFLLGLALLVVGPLCVRIYCELLIVLFRINDTLTEIKNKTP
jgi:hypothetical protein